MEKPRATPALRLTLRQLQVFIAVARHGSTATAGERIALSQSATSAAINDLERLLALRLFDRVGKRLVINDNGRSMVPRVQSLLDSAADIERTSVTGTAQIRSLRLGASTTIGSYVLPRLLARLFADHHAVAPGHWHSRVAVANTVSIGRAVAAFEIDVGFVEGAVNEPDLEVIPWLQDEMVVVGRSGLQAPGTVMPVRALRDAVWLVRETGSGTREAADQSLLPHLRAYRRTIEIGSSEAIKHAAAQGLGLAFLSRWVVEDFVRHGQLQEIRTMLPKTTRPCYILLHHVKERTLALQTLLDAVAPRVPAIARSEARFTPPGVAARSRRER